MAKINYRKCDICGRTDGRIGKFYIYKIWNRLFNKLDICTDCMNKIRQFSVDTKDETKYVKEIFESIKKYNDDIDLQVAYVEGLDDMLGVLSHKRLKNIKR